MEIFNRAHAPIVWTFKDTGGKQVPRLTRSRARAYFPPLGRAFLILDQTAAKLVAHTRKCWKEEEETFAAGLA